jgi:hypothetical protein
VSRVWGRGSIAALLIALALTGCADEGDHPMADGTWSPPASPAPSGEAAAVGIPPPAAAAGKSTAACPKGLAFDLAKDWKAKPIADDVAMFDVGGNHPVCEVDGKPAGVIGFLRVYVSPHEPRKALETIVGAEKDVDKQGYEDVPVGGGSGVEVVYTIGDNARRAFAVRAGSGSVLVTWGGLDVAEFNAGLAAYELAKHTAVVL